MLVIKDLHSDISDQFWLFYGYKYIIRIGTLPFFDIFDISHNIQIDTIVTMALYNNNATNENEFLNIRQGTIPSESTSSRFALLKNIKANNPIDPTNVNTICIM